jgi:hypothetical protein
VRPARQDVHGTGADIGSSSKYIGTVTQIYPNNILVEAPSHIELWSVWPDVAELGKCMARMRFMVRPGILSREMEARIRKSWDILRETGMEEDFPIEAFIQENAQTWPRGTFQYDANEKSAQHLHRDIDGDVVTAETVWSAS